MQQYQQTQALLKAEYAKATNAPNPAMAQQFYTNAQTLQNRIQSLQALLKAQPNLQQQAQMQAQQQAQARGVGAGQMGGPMQMGGQQAGQGQQPGQQQHMMVNGMAGMTPQQRAAQLANAQAAASRITPAMAANDPGLMASIMGPGGGMPNGSGTPRPPQGPHNGMQQPNAQGTGPQGPMGQLGQQQSGQLGQHQQQQQQQHLVGFDYHNTTAQIEAQRARTAAMQQGGGMAGMQNAGSPFQHGGGQRPSSHQGGVQEDPNQSHFAAVSSAGGQGQPTRPTMQRTPSSIGMGPPGPQHASSPSPRNQPGNLASGAQNAGSPSYPVPNTPKMGGAEKPKKKESRQRVSSNDAGTPSIAQVSRFANNCILSLLYLCCCRKIRKRLARLR